MSISIVGSPVTGSDATGSAITLSLPTLSQNDVVYVCACNSWASGTMTTSGYTQIATSSNAGTKVFRKKMGASPDTTAQITGNGNGDWANCAIAICLRLVDTTTQEDATATTTVGGSTNPDAPSITTVTNSAWVLAFAGSTVDDPTVTAPSGYSNAANISQLGNVSSISLAVATKVVSPAGAENPPSWTNWDTGTWDAISVAVRPAFVAAAPVDSLFLGMM